MKPTWPRADADNKRLFGAALDAANACEQRGYDGMACVEALPELVEGLSWALDEIESWYNCNLSGGDENWAALQRFSEVIGQAKGMQPTKLRTAPGAGEG